MEKQKTTRLKPLSTGSLINYNKLPINVIELMGAVDLADFVVLPKGNIHLYLNRDETKTNQTDFQLFKQQYETYKQSVNEHIGNLTNRLNQQSLKIIELEQTIENLKEQLNTEHLPV